MKTNTLSKTSRVAKDKKSNREELDELWLTIENTPEDRLEILRKMEKLQLSITETKMKLKH
ncbi:MAG: hypothetical protein CFH08_00323 [Alphaproteobacteria bacterium MarineAlpha3_Bin7]|nr:MAG: hypothetical protein CFH08_00323 [Alphaproteobacteria bacterium MarineAlpha3_Bin7]